MSNSQIGAKYKVFFVLQQAQYMRIRNPQEKENTVILWSESLPCIRKIYISLLHTRAAEILPSCATLPVSRFVFWSVHAQDARRGLCSYHGIHTHPTNVLQAAMWYLLMTMTGAPPSIFKQVSNSVRPSRKFVLRVILNLKQFHPGGVKAFQIIYYNSVNFLN